MKLKNNALQELYDTLVSGNPTFSPYAESPIDKAFRECDEKLQKDIDIWRRFNEFLRSANSDLASNKRKLEKEIEELKEHVLENHKIIAYVSSERDALAKERDDLLSRTHCAEDEVEELKIELHTAEKARDNIRAELEAKVKRMDEITNDLVDAKIQIKYFKESRDDWQSRVNNAEEEIEKLKATLEKANADRTELQKDRDSYHDLYTELSKTYDKLSEDNRKLKARTDCHRYEVEWYRKHYKEQSDKIQELKKELDELTSQYQKLTIENKRLQNSVRAGYDQGQTDLWVKLQDVNDVQPEYFDVECETLGDVIDMDLEDFLDAYKKWQEEKEKNRLDHIRDYLDRFCRGRLCTECPFRSDEYKCGNGYSFRKFTDNDCRIIPDEELEKYYEKARGCGKLFIHDLSHPMAGANEAIKNACERFTKAVEAANINISTRAWHGDATAEKIKIEPWSCTLEGTINVEFDRDLLEKVCGVKPDDKK